MALKITQAIYSFMLVLFTAIFSKYFTDIGLENFYDTLNISDATPKNNYFIYVWRVLYFLLFLSFYIILLSKKSIEQFNDANSLFISQLFLQVLWCFSFFYMEQLIASSIVLILLFGVVLLMMQSFYQINKVAFVLNIPYVVWVLFATFLNIYISFSN